MRIAHNESCGVCHRLVFGGNCGRDDCPRPPPKTSADYDRLAEAFYHETGIMAPGKDVPAAMGETHTMEERQRAWKEWLLRPAPPRPPRPRADLGPAIALVARMFRSALAYRWWSRMGHRLDPWHATDQREAAETRARLRSYIAALRILREHSEAGE